MRIVLGKPGRPDDRSVKSKNQGVFQEFPLCASSELPRKRVEMGEQGFQTGEALGEDGGSSDALGDINDDHPEPYHNRNLAAVAARWW